jgi:hypothetical protein
MRVYASASEALLLGFSSREHIESDFVLLWTPKAVLSPRQKGEQEANRKGRCVI